MAFRKRKPEESAPFWRVVGNSPDGLPVNESWFERAKGQELCRGCRRYDRRHYARPLPVCVDKQPRRYHMFGVWKAGVAVHSAEWIQTIHEYYPEGVAGPVYFETDILARDYHTMYGPRAIVLRGRSDSWYYPCAVCGSVSSFPKGEAHVLRSALDGTEVFQTESGRFLISDRLRSVIEWSQFPDLELDPVHVKDEPIDGRDFRAIT